MGKKCNIKQEICQSFKCTSYDGKLENGRNAWGELDKVMDKIPCESCKDDGKKRLSGLHDIINLGIGETKKPFNKKNLKKFVEETLCVYKKCVKNKECEPISSL